MNAWTGDVKATAGTFSVHPVEYTRYQSAAHKRDKYAVCAFFFSPYFHHIFTIFSPYFHHGFHHFFTTFLSAQIFFHHFFLISLEEKTFIIVVIITKIGLLHSFYVKNVVIYKDIPTLSTPVRRLDLNGS